MKPIQIELPTQFSVGSVNSYLFLEPEVTLVDCGVKSEACWAALQAGLAANGLSVADVQRVVITHAHVDHFGLAGRIVAASDAVVECSTVAERWLVDFPARWQERIAFYEAHFLPGVGLPEEMNEVVTRYMTSMTDTCDPIPAERLRTFEIEGEIALGGQPWQVLFTPGHASMQTCFYQPEREWLLSADCLLPKTPTPVVERPFSGTRHTPGLPKHIDSLNRLAILDVETVFPGHGLPFGNHRALIKKQISRIEKRKQECLALIANGHQTLGELVNVMYAHYSARVRFAGLWMLVGYLDLLKAEGAVQEETVDGVWHYSVYDNQ